VEEASRLYAAGGYPGLSLAALAERAGVTKATVFHYFSNKDALVYAVFEALGQRLEAATLGCLDPPPQSHGERLERWISALVDFYGADPLNARLLCHGLLESEKRVSGANAPPVFGHFVQRLVAFLSSGIAAGEFYPDRPVATIVSLGGVILFEHMIPADARRFYEGLEGPVPLAQRKRELSAWIRRAVVRPAARLGWSSANRSNLPSKGDLLWRVKFR